MNIGAKRTVCKKQCLKLLESRVRLLHDEQPGETGGTRAAGRAATRTKVVLRMVRGIVVPGRPALLWLHAGDRRFHGDDGPGLIAPQAPPQVFGVGHGSTVQKRALHERCGVLQGSGLAGRQPRQAAVAQRERRSLVTETEVPVRRDCFLLLPMENINRVILLVVAKSKRCAMKSNVPPTKGYNIS